MPSSSARWCISNRPNGIVIRISFFCSIRSSVRFDLPFDSIDEYLDRHDNLTALGNAASRFAILQCKLAVICRDEEFEIVTSTRRLRAALESKPIRFPVIVDTDNRIASMYGMLSADGPLWGHVIADSNARVRSSCALYSSWSER